MQITFIGLGIMGSRMAANLLKQGVDLTVWNRSPEPVEQLVSRGARAGDSLHEAVSGADIVFSMLSTPEVVESLFMRGGAALSSMKPRAIWADSSTVNPSFSRKAAEVAQKADVRFMDAPVAGTLPHAEKAELTFFVGASEELLAEVEPYMDMMSQKVLRIGETGMGASFKMLVNAMLAQSMVVFSETVVLGEKMGISRDFLLKVLPKLVVAAPFTQFKAEMIKEGEYGVQFPLEWMHKDLHLAATTAYELNQPLYLANLAKELFAEANKKGLGRLDFAAIHKFLEER